MNRPHRILLFLSDSEFERLLDVKKTFQFTSKRKISKSDVLRRALFSLPVQCEMF